MESNHKILNLNPNSFVRIKNLNNNLIMFQSSYISTSLHLIDSEHLTDIKSIEIGTNNEYTINDVLFHNDYYYVICNNVYNVYSEITILVYDKDFNLLDNIKVPTNIGIEFNYAYFINNNLAIYLKNLNKFDLNSYELNNSNLNIGVFYENNDIVEVIQRNERKTHILSTEGFVVGSYVKDNIVTVYKKFEYGNNVEFKSNINESLEEMTKRNVIIPVNCEQIIFMDNNIIGLIVDDGKYALITNLKILGE